MSTTNEIGDRGEDIAADYLGQQDYQVIERNYRFERNEIDLVCLDPSQEVVFVEVKTRTGHGFGAPEEAVTEEKQQALIEVARAYLHERKLEGTPARFDVVSVMLQADADPEIEHYENAFWL